MKKLILGMAACAALCACTSDDLLVDDTPTTSGSKSTGGLYMKFNLEMPTRSATNTGDNDTYVTSEDGTEVGKSYENNVSNVLILLTTEEDTPIAFAKEYSGTSSTFYVATFEAADIESHAGETVKVVVLCNTDVTDESYDEDGEYTLTAQTDEKPWTNNQFFMSNAEEYTNDLPDNFDAYKDINTPYDIGTVKVERSCARFDYKDGGTAGSYTYAMMLNENEQPQINLIMDSIALINLSKSFYYLRRTAESLETNADVADLGNTTLLGVEKVNNWVIDTDAYEKMSYADDNLMDNFFCQLSSPSTWDWTAMTTIAGNDADEWSADKSYNIWRYATENTIPSVEQQKHGITTGVVFKCRMEPTADCDADLAEAFSSNERIFVFANEVVGTWDMVEKYAKDADNETTQLAAAYRNVMGAVGESYTAAELSEAQASEGFTGYSPDSNGDYYVYYYYWNRHNDNGENADMGIMEFGVVRNNVYKLSVTGISLFGHPTPADPGDTDPDPDPDPENPDDEDEDDNIYIQVEVEILPWVVRVNDIEF